MPTISGMRRRGYTPNGIKLFAKRCGVSKSPNIVDIDFLESAIREDLEDVSPKVMAVLKPLKVILTNFGANTASRNAPFHPQKPELGERLVELTKELYIERDDFMEVPIDGWQRLSIGVEVRLRHSYVILCNEVIKNNLGEIVELHCSIDHATLGKNPEGRKVSGVIHWVSTTKSVEMTVRLYDKLFNELAPDQVENVDFTQLINKDSLTAITGYIEPVVIGAKPETHYQFERLGYYVVDRYDSNDSLVFNKTVGLKGSWAKK